MKANFVSELERVVLLILTVAVLVALLAVGGCAMGKLVLMRGPSGDIVRCEVEGKDWVAVGMANIGPTVERCAREYEKAGYTRVR